MRIVFADGTLLDTSDAASRDAFKRSHAALLKARRAGCAAARARAPCARCAAR
jgi:D-lactate dehydrogenase